MSSRIMLDVAKKFAGIAVDLAAQPDVDALSDRIRVIGQDVLGCPWIQVLQLTEKGALSFKEPADPTIRALLRIAVQERDDVVSQTITSDATIVVADFATEHRWRDYSMRVATETPIRSALSFPLTLSDTQLGVLAAFSPAANFFDSAVLEAGRVLSEHAAVALAHVASIDRAHNLEIALLTNRTIGVAIGILMARLTITDQQAFDLLRCSSQQMHRKLHDIAEHVTLTGELPQGDAIIAAPRNTETAVSVTR